MDGDPLSGALVSFSPAQGRSAIGYTNDKGEYSVKYVSNVAGAIVGKNQVSITTAYDEADPKFANFKEPIPKNYNTNTELERDVQQGTNKFDFDLLSK